MSKQTEKGEHPMDEQPYLGWLWPTNSRKAHYFDKDKMSLCHKWWCAFAPAEDFVEGNDDSPDNCRTCLRKLQKLRAKPTVPQVEVSR